MSRRPALLLWVAGCSAQIVAGAGDPDAPVADAPRPLVDSPPPLADAPAPLADAPFRVDARFAVDAPRPLADAPFRADASPGSPDAMSPPLGSCARPMFPSNSPWNQRIDGAALDPASDAIIASLQNAWSHHGEPNDNPGHMHIDFSLDVLCAGAGTPFRSFSKNSSWYEGECDDVQMPVPVGGNVEGQPGYQCPIADEDCHLLVVHTPTRTLYEQIAVNIDSGGYSGGCVARWDMTRTYPPSLRGEQCTSADAAALPIAALLFDADEVAAGAIEHAVRFAISNDKIRHSQYVRPAAHATGAASGGATALPYGVRLRLKSSFDVASLPSAGARVVATALKRYGMILADGGQIVLMGQSDRHTVAKWSGRLAPHDLEALRPDNFEVVNMGTVFTWTGDCVLE